MNALLAMNRIYVSPMKLKSGDWSSRRILFAAFHSVMDMYRFRDHLAKENPTWVMETYEVGRKRVRRGAQ